jgi:hypothetical protein
MASAATLLVLTALLGAACGGSGDEPATETAATPEPAESADIAGDAKPADVKVIDAWSRALADGDVEGAAEYFAIPSTAENGLTIEIDSAEDARLFNESLPCGAELIEAQSEGEFTTATFRLKERPGPGTCGEGVGAEAQTAFVIDGGKITEWRRVVLDGAEPPAGQAT